MNKIKLLLSILILFSTLLGVGCPLTTTPPPDVSLTTSITPNGGGTVSPNSGMFPNGVTETLVATPNQYYVFSGWAGDISGMTNPISLKMNSNKTVVATFSRINYSLTTSVGAPGGGTITPASGNFDAGTTVTITANPSPGYAFVRWDNSTSSSNVISILMNANKTITAFFAKLLNLSVSISPSGSGTVTPSSGTYVQGGKVNLKATSIFPYAFKSWTNTDNNSTNPTTVTMNADTNVTVNFIQLDSGPTQTSSGQWDGNEKRIPIILGAGQWIKGTIDSAFLSIPYSILDPTYTVVQDLGTHQSMAFTFQAQTNGTYYFDLGHGLAFMGYNYTLTYSIYS